MLRSRDGQRITIISHENYAGLLADLIERLPHEGELVGAQIFSSKDKRFLIDIFDFKSEGEQASDPVGKPQVQSEVLKKVVALTRANEQSIEDFIANYHPGSPILDSAEEIAKQFLALDETRTTSDLTVIWEVRSLAAEDRQAKRFAKVVVSSVNATTRSIFHRAAEFFAKYCIDVERAFCESISTGEKTKVALLTFHICIENQAFDLIRQQFGEDCSEVLDGDVLRSKLVAYLRLDEEVVSHWLLADTSLADHFGDALDAELFCGLARLTHYAFAFQYDTEISREKVFRRLIRFEHTPAILSQFKERFRLRAPEQQELVAINLDSISDVNDRLLVKTFQELAQQIQRTNVGIGKRRALAFRFSGDLIANSQRGETAFAVFYVYGQGFDGFHVRFRDVARGGMRIVPTWNPEHYLFESSRVFDEAYRLAAAQQLKNKDIAEGGAKAVVVLKPATGAERAGHDFVDALLDLVTLPQEVTASGCEGMSQEYLYLGPDENVTNSLINWIVNRAAYRGYPFPATLMSSKPVAGINHKEFGVTSEGVTVFLHQALLEIGIDPSQQSFTLKMTGGPDGDVGGNEIRILIREYGSHAVFVAIADGTGAAEDRDGLNHEELMRLVNAGLGIAHFSPNRLGSRGRVSDLSDESGIAWRNNLHFTAVADVFVPAGGRPSAINENNWRQFLDENGVPSSKVIVEGANLFITESARQRLSEQGVTIVKDSSANKCGVICSSLEIIAGMVLNENEFEEVKPAFVEDVLRLLKSLASIEAVSLFNEHARQSTRSLPEISVALSQQIIRVADVISRSCQHWNAKEEELADQFILEFLPRSLVEKTAGNLISRIPPVYRRQLIAAILSSRVVYREGYRNVCELSSDQLEALVKQQLVYESEIREILERIRLSDLPDREKIIKILDHAGARVQRELKL